MATGDVEQACWAQLECNIVYTDIGYGIQSTDIESKDLEGLPTIVVESQANGLSDAPIVIFPNDPSAVGAEEIVMEEGLIDLNFPEAEEEVVGPGDDVCSQGGLPNDELPEIPLNDQTYATFHPFPCDFCCRRFKKKANLINHMVAHQTKRPHGCNVCSSRFMRKCDLVNHMKIHSYIPNRENRHSVMDDGDCSAARSSPSHFPTRDRRKPIRGRRRSSGGSARRTSGRIRSVSPDSSPSSKFSSEKLPNYVDEDVKLLLEMTNKLHENRKSESESSMQLNSPDPKLTATPEKPYICTKCNRCFARESALVSHSQVHSEEMTYDCHKCHGQFYTEQLLKDHISKKHLRTLSAEINREDGLPSDKGYTGDERFGTFYCDICAISFHKPEQLRSHKRILHSLGEEFTGLYHCGSCSSLFLTNEKLLEHLDESSECQNHVCLLCGEHFPDQALVQAHIKSKHSRDMPAHTCDLCGKQCRAPQTLRKHMWLHQTDRRYPCKEISCPKKFNNWEQLKRHMQTHSSRKSVTCEDCDERFPDRRSLLNHRHSHLPSTSGRRFICNDCGKTFGSRSSQQIHNRIHTGERPYGCRYCWKAFADGGTLRKHERIHTGEKPYVCAVCPRAFNQRVVLREHIRSHHSGLVTKVGRSDPVYMCQVCDVECDTSEELSLHIVHHSDANTRKNRSAPPLVRPYRRRTGRIKSGPTLYSGFGDNDLLENNSETDSADSEKPIDAVEEKKPSRARRSSLSKFSLDPFDTDLRDIRYIMEPQSKKAKMINTKLQPLVRGGKRGPKKRGRKVEVVSSPVVVPRPRVRTMSGRLSGRRESTSYTTELNEPRRRPGRPRTRNISCESLGGLEKGFETGTFSSKMEIKVEPSSDELDGKVEPVVLELSDGEERDDHHRECGICGQVFASKADLLFHVPVHI